MSLIEESKTIGKTIQIACPRCDANTKHTVERALDWSNYYKEPDFQVWGTLQIIRCNGCDTLSFRSIDFDSESFDSDYRSLETEKLYPERKNRSVTDELYLRDDVYEIPEIIQAIYRETLSAVQHDLPTLTGIGIRAIIDVTCRDLKAKGDNLFQKINKLVTMSLLTPDGAKILHGIRLLGNDAAHEMKPPRAGQITAALKVIDHLLLGVYVLPKEASVLPKPKSAKDPNSDGLKESTSSEKSGTKDPE